MDVTKILAPLKYRLSRLVRREDGSSIIELAIVFPILLLLFVGTAELGRLFYTYTTLAKATKVGARYLSTSRDAKSSNVTTIAAVKLKAQNLVVYGCTDRTLAPCSTTPPIVAGLAPATNIKVTLPVTGTPIKYVKVEIQNYNYAPGVFNLASMTGAASTAIYFPLTPGTEMRYMQE
jgi:Flp pilus assembly protein TadG